MKWWEKPRSIEDLRSAATFELLHNDTIYRYTMVDGEPVVTKMPTWVQMQRDMLAVRKGFEQMAQAAVKAGEEFRQSLGKMLRQARADVNESIREATK